MSASFPKNRWYALLADRVSPGAFHLGYLLIENFLFPGKTDCWATQETMAKLGRTSPRNVRRLTTEIIDSGLLNMKRGGKGHANRYVPVLLERTDLSYQNDDGKSVDRTDSSYDDRTDLSSDIPAQTPEGRDGPLTGPVPTTAEAGLKGVAEDPSTNSEIDNGAGAGRMPTPATSSRSDRSSVTVGEPEALQSVDAMEGPLRPNDEVPPFASASSIEDGDDWFVQTSPFNASPADEEEDDLSWWDAPRPPSRTPIADLFREERNDVIASFAQLRSFAAEEGLDVSEEELDELAEELGHDERQEAQASGLPVDRAPDEDDFDRLRQGVLVDRHGRPFVIERDGSAYGMLTSDLRRAAFVGKRCDQLAALRPSERPAAWKKTCADMHRLLDSEGYGTTVYDRLIEPLSAEVKAEMTRRVSAFSRHFQEANS